jgi:hypothetical protein
MKQIKTTVHLVSGTALEHVAPVDQDVLDNAEIFLGKTVLEEDFTADIMANATDKAFAENEIQTLVVGPHYIMGGQVAAISYEIVKENHD